MKRQAWFAEGFLIAKLIELRNDNMWTMRLNFVWKKKMFFILLSFFIIVFTKITFAMHRNYHLHSIQHVICHYTVKTKAAREFRLHRLAIPVLPVLVFQEGKSGATLIHTFDHENWCSITDIWESEWQKNGTFNAFICYR